jgi:hypothetical protein
VLAWLPAAGAAWHARDTGDEPAAGTTASAIPASAITASAIAAHDTTVRGTPCRVAVLTAGGTEFAGGTGFAGGTEFTVWAGDGYLRRIRCTGESPASRPGRSVRRSITFEMWDFGVAVDSLDWARLPSFGTPGDRAVQDPVT